MTRTPSPAALRARLETALDDSARTWLDQALAEAAAHREDTTEGPVPAWELRFAQAGRRCGAHHADAARLLLLHAARADIATLTRLYGQGTAAERRAVLHALTCLVPGDEALGLVHDALRANDTSLVAAALGPYGAEHLDAHDWRHAVLKCLCTGVRIDAASALAERARGDAELARMLGDHARERTAAGRPVPGDLHRLLMLTGPPPAADAEPAAAEPAADAGPAQAASAASPQEN
ncbi:EboA domain-containing protein [Streptomyces sp. KLOTTS4A1]|uniref:EboA domain-containing protein n=1 Tax=Streptomyces sp. KLOTTS4A1 TaxID=3390996 RepID=UPI0039F538CF